MNTDQNTYYCELPQLGLITLTGPDATKFLQGQVTSDVRELAQNTAQTDTQGVSQLGAQCNLKGRVMANFRALQMAPELIALCVSADLIAETIASLNKYIVFSKAKLHDTSSQFTLIGLYGVNASSTASRYFGQTPAENNGWIAHQGNYLIKLDEQRYECWINNSSLSAFSTLIANEAMQSNSNLWNLLDIRAGIAWVTAATRELFTPQALNYQLINAISFRKGCYTGQEIVARMHYRGKLKRHLYRYETRSEILPTVGTSIYNSSGEHVLGEVVCAAFSQSGQIELLASINGEDYDDLCLANNPEKLKRLALPYAIPSGEETPSNR